MEATRQGNIDQLVAELGTLGSHDIDKLTAAIELRKTQLAQAQADAKRVTELSQLTVLSAEQLAEARTLLDKGAGSTQLKALVDKFDTIERVKRERSTRLREQLTRTLGVLHAAVAKSPAFQNGWLDSGAQGTDILQRGFGQQLLALAAGLGLDHDEYTSLMRPLLSRTETACVNQYLAIYREQIAGVPMQMIVTDPDPERRQMLLDGLNNRARTAYLLGLDGAAGYRHDDGSLVAFVEGVDRRYAAAREVAEREGAAFEKRLAAMGRAKQQEAKHAAEAEAFAKGVAILAAIEQQQGARK